jgi:UDP-glucuronate decarboxylase
VEVEQHELPADDPRQRQPDISRARELLGWEPRMALEEGLERTIDYFRRMLGKNEPMLKIVRAASATQPRD